MARIESTNKSSATKNLLELECVTIKRMEEYPSINIVKSVQFFQFFIVHD